MLQTILPVLMTAESESFLALEEENHNPFAPPWNFLDKTFLPLKNRIGPVITTTLERPGFYPGGGGGFRIHIYLSL